MARVVRGGYYASRKKERLWRRLRLPAWHLPRWFWFLAIAVLLWIVGLMQAWPQQSEPLSNNSVETLSAWETLFAEGRRISGEQKKDLEALKKELLDLRIGSQELTDLSGRLSESNESLRTYNEQIAERMQERDEDLALAYEDIDRLEKQRLKLVLAIVVLGAALSGIIILKFVLRK